MDKALKWVKDNVKDGVDTAEFEKMLSGSFVPADMKKDDALKFIRENAALNSAHDAAILQAIKTHDEKFESEKLPKIIKAKEKELREQINKELNPEETPEQKQIRELREQLEGMAKEKANVELKDSLRAKAKELGFDMSKAERYYVYGDKALDVLQEDAEWFKTQINTETEAQIKARFGDNPTPTGGKSTPPAGQRDQLIAQYNEIEASNDPNKGAKLIALKDQIAKLPKQ